jgi:alkylglycerol monooxygenase
MNFVPYAIPVFLLMIVLELGYGLLKGNNTYRVNDSINSLSMGLLSTVTKFVFLNIGALVFAQISREYAVWSFDINSLGHWLLAILLYDFLYYWFHRISHERQFFWAPALQPPGYFIFRASFWACRSACLSVSPAST